MVTIFCCRFRIDNTDHIIDVNKNNAAFEYDQVNIICPVYQPGTYDEEAEKYIIYNVSNEKDRAFVIVLRLLQAPGYIGRSAIMGLTDKSSYTTVDPLCEIKNCHRAYRVV